MSDQAYLSRIARMYFVVQAVAIVAWWVVLAAAPQTRSYFTIRGAPLSTLGSFALGDIGIIAIGSAVVGLLPGWRWSVVAASAISGALLYATCYSVAAAATGSSSPVGALLMVPASMASIVASAILSGDAHADPLSSRAAP